MRIALCQTNPKVAAVEENTQAILELIRKHAREVDLLIFPELVVPGYPPTDLLSKRSFQARIKTANEVLIASSRAHDCAIIFGTVLPDQGDQSARTCNGAIIAEGGVVRGTARKALLPTYGVYDEARFFAPGREEPTVININGVRFGVAICEDFWAVDDPSDLRCYGRHIGTELRDQGAQILLNLSASPWHQGKVKERQKIVGQVAIETGLNLLYCNLVGANDDLIFDGRSLAWDPHGKVIARAKAFEEDVLFLNLDESRQLKPREQSSEDSFDNDLVEVAHALSLGIRDYCQKSHIDSVLIGMSGGIDSAVTASLAAFALGAENVTGVSMPGEFSSPKSLEFARKQAELLGMKFHEIPITQSVETVAKGIHDRTGSPLAGLSHENLQARMRGVTLMALSNRDGAMVLNTGNKSELATGYCTLYGDMVGGLAVLGDLLKHQVYALGRALDGIHGTQVIPEGVYSREPSAELSANQIDSDSLPNYSRLDRFVEQYICEDRDALDAAPEGLDGYRWANTIERMDYKRFQAPPILRVSPRAFGRGRQTINAKG